MAGAVKVEGLNELVRAFGKIDKELRRGVQRELGEAAKIVRDEASAGFMHVSAKSASSFRPRVRGATAVVEQRRARTTGKRPDFGRHQMRYLMRALGDKSDMVVARLELMIDRLGGEAGF